MSDTAVALLADHQPGHYCLQQGLTSVPILLGRQDRKSRELDIPALSDRCSEGGV